MTFVIAHLSDPHIGPLPRIPLAHLANKRLTGALNWHSARADIHNMDVLSAIIADIAAHQPDHVALTGDLVNVGYEPEFPQALAMASLLGPPDRVSVIPGNHDAYIRGSLAGMERAFRPFMLGDGRDGIAFPYLRQRDGIALIGVNSGVPTLPFMATGRVGAAQRDRLAALLNETGRQGLFRVVMIHHPPLARAARFGRGLTDAEAVTALLARHGAELVLHGHNHRHSLLRIETARGTIPVLGVASASAVPGTAHHLAEYHLIRIDEDTRSITVIRRGYSGNGPGISDIQSIPLRSA